MESNAITSTSTSITSNTNNNKTINTSDEKTIIIRRNQNLGNGNGIGLPFTIKVGQVFTGFGVGCGLGIGLGTPFNFGAIPMLNQVMSAASGATYAVTGIGRHVNQSLKKIGAKNIQAGVGCGVGFGHGFGAGIALKPGVTQQIQLFIMGAVSKLMMKFGGTNLSFDQGLLPASVQSSLTVVKGSAQDPLGSIAQIGKNVPAITNQGPPGDGKVITGIENFRSENVPSKLALSSRTEKLIHGFSQDTVPRGENTEDEQFELENRVLRMVVKHQQVIEELIEENERLRQVLLEDLKVPASKLQKVGNSRTNVSPCSDCFDCRRKQRRK